MPAATDATPTSGQPGAAQGTGAKKATPARNGDRDRGRE